jgi:hypothetical protein
MSALSVFEVVLPGFDGSTDETDDKVLWIAAKTLEEVQRLVDPLRAEALDGLIDQEVAELSRNLDYTLPADADALLERVDLACTGIQEPI